MFRRSEAQRWFGYTLFILLAAGWIAPATGGAWTLPAGDTQIISGAIYSTATASFDDSGGTVPTLYRKILLQSYAEHGLTDDLTLVLRVLQVVLLDVFPDLGNHLAARQLRGTDDGGKLRRRRERLLQGVCFLWFGHGVPPAGNSGATPDIQVGAESLGLS